MSLSALQIYYYPGYYIQSPLPGEHSSQALLNAQKLFDQQRRSHHTRYQFNICVESSKCRLISCQRILRPCWDSNPRPSSKDTNQNLILTRFFWSILYGVYCIVTRIAVGIVTDERQEDQVGVRLPLEGCSLVSTVPLRSPCYYITHL